ncbi:16156_t:CDS:1, partial [Racocetra persica]
MVSRWREQEEDFRVARSFNQRVGSGNKLFYSLAEEVLKHWIDKLCYEGIA